MRIEVIATGDEVLTGNRPISVGQGRLVAELTDRGRLPIGMLGLHVMTQHHIQRQPGYEIGDSIGLGSYSLDSHGIRRVVIDGKIRPERRLEAADYWVLKHNLGDTLNFKMYHKDKDKRYAFVRNVTFVASDTSTVVRYFKYYGPEAECFDDFPMYCYRLRFSGPYKLDFEIEPQGLGP